MRHFAPLFFPLLLAACGAETVGTAAVGGESAVEQAQEAQALKEQVQQQLDGAAQLEQQRLEQADRAANGAKP
ncbi:MAG: hypothetical protein AB1899_04235 [Pseudomonadota bacterium]